MIYVKVSAAPSPTMFPRRRGRLVMIGKSIGAARLEWASFGRLVATLLLAAFVVSLIALNGANACPTGTKSHHAAIQHKKPSNTIGAPLSFTTARPAITSEGPNGHCCGGPFSNASSSCKSGCCYAGVAVANLGTDGLAYVCLPPTYSAGVADQLTPVPPPIHFRPPPSLA